MYEKNVVIAFDDTFQSKCCNDRHERNKDLGMKDEECNECGAKFSAKYKVEGHKRTHHKVSKMSCNKCNKEFAFKHSLNRAYREIQWQ